MATRDTYTKVHEVWKDKPDKTTPCMGADLMHFEDGISDAMDNRALREIYRDDGIELVIDSSEDEESPTTVISIMKASENEEDETDLQYIHQLDSSGNATFAGDVKNGQGVSLNDLKSEIDNININPGGGESSDTPIATIETPGKVKPDGTTITIDADGTIHAVSSQELADSVLGGES